MPQFDPTWFVSQIFWLAIVLGVLYWLMSKHAIPRVQAALEARAERIQGDLDRAAKLQQDAAALAESHAATISKAKDEAREALRVAQADTQAALDSRQTSLAEEIAKQTSEAEKRISVAKDEAMSNVRDIAIEAAQAIAERLTHSNIDNSKTTAAVESAINQRTH
jgi:F-type H+-transporting ATPase subunit b